MHRPSNGLGRSRRQNPGKGHVERACRHCYYEADNMHVCMHRRAWRSLGETLHAGHADLICAAAVVGGYWRASWGPRLSLLTHMTARWMHSRDHNTHVALVLQGCHLAWGAHKSPVRPVVVALVLPCELTGWQYSSWACQNLTRYTTWHAATSPSDMHPSLLGALKTMVDDDAPCFMYDAQWTIVSFVHRVLGYSTVSIRLMPNLTA